jgi:predicted component of type VI protein secretion system
VIQLQILSGKHADEKIAIEHFPFRVGRDASSELQLGDGGVWDAHLQIDFQRGDGFVFTARSEALTVINGERTSRGTLRNGDIIEVGSARLRFWLAGTRQKTLRVREALTWMGLIALFAGQIALIYALLR